jgi:large repetitive protein
LRRFIQVFLLTAILAGIFTATASALRFGDEDYAMPDGEVGTPYHFQMTASAGCPPYKFTIMSGALPDGLTLSSDGIISGTPTKLGASSFWAQLVDTGCVLHGSAEREFTIKITTVKLAVDNLLLKDAPKGQAYSTRVTAHGGTGSYTWALASGTLPAGLSLDPSGTISGTPTTTGLSMFVVKATDTNGKTDTKQLSIKVVDPLGAKLSARVAEVGLSFNATLAGLGGTAGYTLTVAGGLPAGLTFNAGAISGTPTASGAFSLAVAVQDADGLSATVSVPLTVVARLTIAAHLSTATAGRSYKGHVATRGGARPLRFRIASGKLPAGMRLNLRTGVLTGTPRVAGTYRVRVVVTDVLGASAARALRLSVH